MMNLILKHVPLQTRVVRPLAHLAEFIAHEQQLLAGLRVHVAEQQPQVGKASAIRRPAFCRSAIPCRARLHRAKAAARNFPGTNTACGR